MTAAPTDDALLAAIAALGGKILVVGDVMLDVFSYGTTTRISPEAPIPVMRMTHEQAMLGGVGNVARNIAALAGTTVLVGAIGCDADGATLERLVANEPNIESRLIRCDDRRTTTKRRYIVAGQQMLRVDQEDVAALSPVQEARLVEEVLAALSCTAALVLSDYGKGTLPPPLLKRVIEAARGAGKPVLVDPKHRDMTRYAGATCITPNAGELALSTGLSTETNDEVVAAARIMMNESGADFILATRSGQGMSLVSRTNAPVHLPAHRREVFDVSGAGDTVIGALAVAIASGIDWPVAASLANIAAGVVVSKPGTAICSQDELELEVADRMLGLGSKLLIARQASRLSGQWRRLGLRVGFTNGCFDLLHPGHVTLLSRARQACDKLIVGLNSDASVQRLKGPTRPLQNQAARAAVLTALAAVDGVVIFNDDTPLDLIEAIRPSVLFKGADYAIDQVVGADMVIADGGEVKLIELIDGQSTTSLIAKMR